MNFRGYRRQALADGAYTEHGPVSDVFQPSACSYCGGTDFGPETDNGRAGRVTCADCGGTMVSSGSQWMPDLIGQPDNHPSTQADPRSGGVGGIGNVPTRLRENDLSSRTAGARGELPEGMTIERQQYHKGDDEHADLDSHLPGWDHYRASAMVPGRRDPIGHIEYSVQPQDKQITIHETRVNSRYQRQGVGTKLNQTIMEWHPHHDVDRGAATADGEKFRQSLGSVDWCRHRHASHCWLPRNDSHSGLALYTPQDRGICPWVTASMQQINCPMSEPGPMSGMDHAGAKERKEPKPLKRGLGPTHDPSTCPVCRQKNPGPVRHQGAPIPAPYPNPEGGKSWYHGTSFDPEGDEEYVSEHTHYTPPHPTLDGKPFGMGEHHFTGDPGGHLRPPERDGFWGVGSEADKHWNTDLGVHFSSLHHVAADFAERGGGPHERIAHAHLHMGNPAHYPDENHLGAHAINWARSQGHRFLPENDQAHEDFHQGYDEDITHPEHGHDYGYVTDHIGERDRGMRESVIHFDKHGITNPEDHDLDHIDRYLSTHPQRENITAGFREHLESKGHDGIIYGNSIEGPKNHPCAISFPNTLAHVHKWDWQHPSMSHMNEPAPDQERVHAMAALNDPEMGFHLTATWADVRRKATRIRAEGGVVILSALPDTITANVQGDTGVYESQINYLPGTRKVGHWQCGCAWASFTWGRSPAYRRYEGRMCSHTLALQFEAQSWEMSGLPVTEDVRRPGWMRDKVRVRHDRVTRDHDVRAASLHLDPEGVYPDDHGLDLAGMPIYAFAVDAYGQTGDPADAMRVLLSAGIEHTAARELLDTMPRVAARDEPLDEPTHAGVVLKAADTGRVLMIQRSHQDEDDPAAGRWEFPGGGREDGDHNSLMSGVREFEEEVGQPFPTGGHVSHVWRSPNGVYQGHVVVVPSEDAIDFSNGRATTNPDDPDGDHHEQSAWWDPDHARKNPALRDECKSSPWDKIKTAALRTEGSEHHKHKLTPHHPYPGWGGPGGWWLWDDDHDGDGNDADEAGEGISTSAGPRWDKFQNFLDQEYQPSPRSEHPLDWHTERPISELPDDRRTCADCGSPEVAAYDTWHGKGYCADHAGDHPVREHDRMHPVKLAEFRRRCADYSAHDDLGGEQPDWRPTPPPRAPGPGEPVNPGSTGWATSQDPPEWDQASGNPSLAPLTSWSSRNTTTWHITPSENRDSIQSNGLRPSRSMDGSYPGVYVFHGMPAERAARYFDSDYGEKGRHYDVWGVKTHGDIQPDPINDHTNGFYEHHIPPNEVELHHSFVGHSTFRQAALHEVPEPALPSTDGTEETDGERFRAQMTPEIDGTGGDDLTPSDGRTASVSDIVARFQQTAAAQALQGAGKPGGDDMDIASAAKAHLGRKTALKDFSATERAELISEGIGARARNFDDLQVAGTHYADLNEALAKEQSLDEAATDLFS